MNAMHSAWFLRFVFFNFAVLTTCLHHTNIWQDSIDSLSYHEELSTTQIQAMTMKYMQIETIPDATKEDILIPPIMFQLYEEMKRNQCNDQVVLKISPYEFKSGGDQFRVEFEIPTESSTGQLITNINRAELRVEFSHQSVKQENIFIKYEDIFDFHLPRDLIYNSVMTPIYNGSRILNPFTNEPSDGVFDSPTGSEVELTWNITQIAQYSHEKQRPMTFAIFLNHPSDIEPYPRGKNVYVMLYMNQEAEVLERKCGKNSDAILKTKKRVITRRHANKNKSGKRHCKKKSLYVDFEEIGWDSWIVSPDGYRANYCQGTCPFSATGQLNGSNHAIIQALVNTHRPKIPPATCVPDKLTSITMLYLDHNNNVVLRQYPNMVVQSCGCK